MYLAQLVPSPTVYATLRRREGLRLVAYKDTAGKWTIYYGHLMSSQRDEDCRGCHGTVEQAEFVLKADVGKAVAAVRRHVVTPLTQQQFDAVVMWAFCFGEEKMVHGGPGGGPSGLLAALNAGRYRAAADELLRWDKVDGVVVDSLLDRRREERDLFLAGTPK